LIVKKIKDGVRFRERK